MLLSSPSVNPFALQNVRIKQLVTGNVDLPLIIIVKRYVKQCVSRIVKGLCILFYDIEETAIKEIFSQGESLLFAVSGELFKNFPEKTV